MDSYKKGYNATLGGDGTHYINYEKIVKTYNNFQNLTDTAKICNCDISTVRKALKEYSIIPNTFQEVNRKKLGKPVKMIEVKTNQEIQRFETMADAARYCVENNLTTDSRLHSIQSHIGQVANGKRKTAYGYTWQYI